MTKFNLTLALMALGLATMPATASENSYTIMQSSVAASAGSGLVKPQASKAAFQATGRTTSGSGAATVVIYGSNDERNFITLGTITLTLSTTETSDGFTTDSGWKVYRSSVTAISGTGALASVFMSSKN